MEKRLPFGIFTIVCGAFAGAFTWEFFFLMNQGIGSVISVLRQMVPQSMWVPLQNQMKSNATS